MTTMELNILFSRMASSEIPLEMRGPVVEFAIAREIAYRLPLATSKVDSVRLFFSTNHAPLLNSMVSSINEQYPLDVHSTIELAYRIWLYRYNLCHNAMAFKRVDRFADEIAPRYMEVYNTWSSHMTTDSIGNLICGFLNDKFGE